VLNESIVGAEVKLNSVQRGAHDRGSYGAPELKKRYRTFFIRGLGISIALHFFMVAMYWAPQYFVTAQKEPRGGLIVKYADLGPPPSLQHDLVHGMPSAKFAFKDFSFGVPVPVPDLQVQEERPFPTVEQLSEMGNTVGNGSGGGISIPDSVQADLLGNDLEGLTPDVAPVLMKIVVPQYPELAMRKKISGTVWLNVLVDEKGAVKTARVLKSNAEELDEAAIQTAKKYTFIPGTYHKKPIPVWVSIPIQFRLEGN
jgi:TonB family protein